MKYLYLVTIKNNAYRYTSRDDILKKLKVLQEKVPKGSTWHKYFFELDSMNRWHLHTLVCTKSVPYFSKLQVKGWTNHLKAIPIDDYPLVLKYIHKDRSLSLDAQDIRSKQHFCDLAYDNAVKRLNIEVCEI